MDAYDRAGFYAYHLAEHHSTPLGIAPSPSVFLSAVGQRTRRLRFGPLVWAMPLHHPLRLIEEICMLDQISGGRLEIGFGRGSVPIEIEYYGADPAEAQETYAEAVEVVLAGLTSKVLDFQGKRFYLPQRADGDRAAAEAASADLVRRDMPGERRARGAPQPQRRQPRSAAQTRLSIDRYREIWPQVHATATPFPKLGLGRFVVVAPTDAEAMALARRAYLRWHASFTHLFRRHGRPQSHPRPATFDLVVECGQGVAGAPSTVARFLSSQLEQTGCNYVVGQFAFGDLTRAECLRSIGLFADEVMPASARRPRPPRASWPALRDTAAVDIVAPRSRSPGA